MKRVSMPIEQSQLLAANDLFYEAFRSGDFRQMEQAWSSEEAISCIHPGWPLLVGRDRVFASWKAIFAGDDSLEINAQPIDVRLLGETALVLTTEQIADSQVLATNVFRLEEDGWKLLHHHAGISVTEENTLGEDDDDHVVN